MLPPHEGRESYAILVWLSCVTRKSLRMHVVIARFSLHAFGYAFRLGFISFKEVTSNSSYDKLSETLRCYCRHTQKRPRSHREPNAVDLTLG